MVKEQHRLQALKPWAVSAALLRCHCLQSPKLPYEELCGNHRWTFLGIADCCCHPLCSMRTFEAKVGLSLGSLLTQLAILLQPGCMVYMQNFGTCMESFVSF